MMLKWERRIRKESLRLYRQLVRAELKHMRALGFTEHSIRYLRRFFKEEEKELRR